MLAGLVDAHVHLQEEILEGGVDEAVTLALSEGVALFVCNATHPGDWGATTEIARRHRSVVPCYGLHPWFVSEAESDWQELLHRLLRDSRSAVGEIGLDATRPDLEAQTVAFRAQLALARELGRPAMIHCVRRLGRLLEILRADGTPEAGVLLHAYSGPAEMIPDFAALGARFSFGGGCLDPRRSRARLALRAVPPELLAVETDAPALPPPEPFRPYTVRDADGGAWNHPANLPSVVGGLAALLDEPVEALGERTARNARALLGDLACRTDGSIAPS